LAAIEFVEALLDFGPNPVQAEWYGLGDLNKDAILAFVRNVQAPLIKPIAAAGRHRQDYASPQADVTRRLSATVLFHGRRLSDIL